MRTTSVCANRAVLLMALGGVMGYTHPALAADPATRCAVLTRPDDAAGSVFADLLAVRLDQEGFQVVDRSHLAKTLGEQALALAFGAEATAARQRVCRIAGADLLVLLTTRLEKNDTFHAWSVSSMPDGVRLTASGALWNEHRPDDTIDAALAGVQRAQRLLGNPQLRYVCVPPFRCRDATYEHNGRQRTLATLVEELLIQAPGIAVVALEEVKALTQEVELTGKIVKRQMPLLIDGAFETQRQENDLLTTIDLELRAGGQALSQRRLERLNDAELAAELQKTLGEMLAEHAGVTLRRAPAEEVEMLRRQATGLIRIGEWNDALPLIQTAALLDPDDVATRELIFLTWNGLVTSTVRLRDADKTGYRVQLMEYALDAFINMIRRRSVVAGDISTLYQFRGHGHLYGSGTPEDRTRYAGFNARHRALLRDIVNGRYGPVDEKTRSPALEQLCSRFARDLGDARQEVFAEMGNLVAELKDHPGDEVIILRIFKVARPRADASKTGGLQFWSACCPPHDRRMTLFADLSDAIVQARTEEDAERFAAALQAAAAELQLPPVAARTILDYARAEMQAALTREAQASVKPAAALPKLQPIADRPNGKIEEWTVSPDGMEFVRLSDAIYRVTPQRTFERVHSGERSRCAWDSQYLWIGGPDRVQVRAADGTLVAESEISAEKFITPIGPGRVFIARHVVNDQGGRRAAHEFWTLHPGPAPRLAQQLIYIADANWSYGVQTGSSDSGLSRLALGTGFLLSDDGGTTGSLFFNNCPTVYIDLPTGPARKGNYTWFMMPNCFRLADTFYLFAGYRDIGCRSRVILSADHPDQALTLQADLGWQRYEGSVPAQYQSRVRSAVVVDGWLHVTADDVESPPQWLALNLATHEIRSIVMYLSNDLQLSDATLVVSPSFGLVLISRGTAFTVTLPPVDAWIPYDQAVGSLRLPPNEIPRDPWAGVRGKAIAAPDSREPSANP